MENDIVKDKFESENCILAERTKIRNLVKNVMSGYGAAYATDKAVLITLPKDRDNVFYYGIDAKFLSDEDKKLLGVAT